MRNTFSEELYKQMKNNKKIWVLTGDLGFGILDKIRESFPQRFLNCGVAEQNMMGVACGLASCGYIPFVYSITSFLLYRPFEFIRIDVNHDRANVKLIGSGRNKDYKDLGYTHWSDDDRKIMKLLPNIKPYWPETKEEVKKIVRRIIKIKGPCYINLKR